MTFYSIHCTYQYSKLLVMLFCASLCVTHIFLLLRQMSEDSYAQARLQEIRSSLVANSTKKTYMFCLKSLIEWLLCHQPQCLTAEFVSRYQQMDTFDGNELDLLPFNISRLDSNNHATTTEDLDDEFITSNAASSAQPSRPLTNAARKRRQKNFITVWLDNAPHYCPFVFDAMDANVFALYIVAIKKEDGTNPSMYTYTSNRAALNHLYRIYSQSMPQQMTNTLKNDFLGLKRTTAAQSADDQAPIKAGKDPMPFSLFRFLGEFIMRSSSKKATFAHTFMVLTWNLMCRAANTVRIHMSHLTWREDALAIYFSQMKNDQYGERPRDPRHIYANPLMPAICPILSLGIYLFCFPPGSEDTKLFPGGSQYNRFSKLFAELLSNDAADELRSRGMCQADIECHSLRKGAATFVTSGCTSGPSMAAVVLRAGWSLPGVQDTYLRYESAGDMFVGRTVSGLSLDSPSFATLPPYFHTDSPSIETVLMECMPDLPDTLKLTARFFMASIVYHKSFLFETLPSGHQLFNCPLFRDSNRLELLFGLVKCRVGDLSDPIRATGVPPHIALMKAVIEWPLQLNILTMWSKKQGNKLLMVCVSFLKQMLLA